MNNLNYSKIQLRKVLAFFAMTIFLTTLLNLPHVLFSKDASAAPGDASDYCPVVNNVNPCALTTTEVSGGATNFKVMEFVVKDYSGNTQDTLVWDAGSNSVAGGVLTEFPTNTKYIESSGTGFTSGEDVVVDLDNDGFYTSAADFLVDANGTTSTTAGTTNIGSAGTSLYDIITSDYLRADSVLSSAVTKVYQDKDRDGRYTSLVDIFVDGDGAQTSGSGTMDGGATAGSTLVSFTTNDNLYYYNTSGTSVLDGLEDIQGLWLDDGDGTFEDSSKASVLGATILSSDFTSGITLTSGSDDTLSIQYSYMNGVSGVTTNTKTLDLTPSVESVTFNDIETLVTAINTAIGVSGFSTVTDFSVTAVAGTEASSALKFETVSKGYGVALSITGGTAKTKLGLDTVTTVSGNDTLIYESTLGASSGFTAGTEVSGSGQGLAYSNITGSASGYQPGEDIFIDQGGRTYSSTQDALILDTANNITTSFTGTNVADTAGWVKQNNSTYVDGDDIFIENVANKLTYSSAADTMVINGSLAQASSGNTLVAFASTERFYDNDSDGIYDSDEDIYKETGTSGGFIDYESLNAITVENAAVTNALAMSDITAVKMYYEANATSATFSGGSTPTESYVTLSTYPISSATHWRFYGQNIQIPDTTGLRVYITVNTASNITEGKKLQFQVPVLVDTDDDGVYDDGDKGVFVLTEGDGPTDQVLISTEVTVSAFGDRFSALEDAIGDFQDEIDDVKLRTSKSNFDDYNDEIDDQMNDLEELLATTIDTSTDVTNFFTYLSNITDSLADLVGLIPTSGDDIVASRDYENAKDAFDAVKEAMDNLVNTFGSVISSSLDDKFDEKNDDYREDWKSLRESMQDKNPDSEDLTGIIDMMEDYSADLARLEENDVPLIEDEKDLENLYDDVADVLNDAIDDVEALDEKEEFDEGDLNDLEDSIDDLRDAFETLDSAVQEKILAVDTANGNDDLDEEYEDEDYTGDMEDLLDELDDAFDELSSDGESTVKSADADSAIDDLDDIIDDIEETQRGVSSVSSNGDMEDYMDELIDYVDDIQSVIEDLPCTLSENDLSDVEDSMDDAKDAVEEARDALQTSLTSRGLFTGTLQTNFEELSDEDLEDAFDDLDEAWDELDKLEGRCEDTDTSGPASITVVASDYELIAGNSGVDTAELTATVRDRSGKALDNRVVNFEVTSPSTNKGTLSDEAVRTDSQGQVTVEYTPGKETTGTVTVKVSSTTNSSVSGTVQLKVINSVSQSSTKDDKDDDEEDEKDSEKEDVKTQTPVTTLKPTIKSGVATMDKEILNKKLDFSAGLVEATTGEKVGDEDIKKSMQNLMGEAIDGMKKVELKEASGADIKYTRDDLEVVFESGTIVYGDDKWSGVIEAPTEITDEVDRAGYSVKTALEVGDRSRGSILFNKPVKVTLPDNSADKVYYSVDGYIWAEIAKCKDGSKDDPGSLEFPGECYVRSSGKLTIWTYHFTQFAVMSQEADADGATKITVLEKKLDASLGGEIKLKVEDSEGNGVSGEAVVVSIRDNETNDIKTYSGSSDDEGLVTIKVPKEDLKPGADYATIATAGDATSGIFQITSTGDGTTEAGEEVRPGGGTVLGAEDNNSAGSGSLPQTGLFPLFTFIFSAIGSYLLIFRRRIAFLENL